MKKLIDIPDDKIEQLKLEAVKAGKSFKKFIEDKICLPSARDIQPEKYISQSRITLNQNNTHKVFKKAKDALEEVEIPQHASNCPCLMCKPKK